MPRPTSSDAVAAQFVQRAKQLHLLPTVALRIQEVTLDPAARVRELQQYVEGFGPPSDTNSTEHLAVIERYWRGTLLKSVAARELAESVWKIPGEESFVAGLLQDVGLLVLVQDLGDSYVKFLHGAWSVGRDVRKMETEILGFDHVQLTAKLLAEWGFPLTLVHAMVDPHDPEKLAELPPPEQVIPQILDLAERLSRFLINRKAQWLDDLLEPRNVGSPLTVDQLKAVLTRMEQKMPPLVEALSLPWKIETGYVRLLMEAVGRKADSSAARTGSPPGATGCQSTRTAGLDHAGIPAETPDLVSTLTAIVGICRRSRLPVSLSIMQLDGDESVTRSRVSHRTLQWLESIQSEIRDAVDGRCRFAFLRVTASRFGVILSGLDRQKAIGVSRHVLEHVRRQSKAEHSAGHLSLSIGLASLAMPPRNFPVQEMVTAAERCLDGVLLCGGDGLKSIDIF